MTWPNCCGHRKAKSHSQNRCNEKFKICTATSQILPYRGKICSGHTVKRDSQFTSLGDACFSGGGAYCTHLEYWFDIIWSETTRKCLHDKILHINVMEFIVVILQLAAVITITEGTKLYQPLQSKYPNGIQPLTQLLIRTDNSPRKIGLTKCRQNQKGGNYSLAYTLTSSNAQTLLLFAITLPELTQ